MTITNVETLIKRHALWRTHVINWKEEKSMKYEPDVYGERAYFKGSHFLDADFNSADLSVSVFTDCIFENCTFVDAKFTHANTSGSIFINCIDEPTRIVQCFDCGISFRIPTSLFTLNDNCKFCKGDHLMEVSHV